MVAKEKQKKKNPAGFFEEQLKLILSFCYATRIDPKIPISIIHKDYSFYSRRKSTTDTLNKAIAKSVFDGPELVINSGIEVLLQNDIDNPREYFEKCKKDKKVNLAFVSHGHWPIFLCKQGANTLQYYEAVLPNNGQISDKKVGKIFYEEKGKLPIDKYPHRWFEKHWKTYHLMKYPRKISFREAGKKLGVHWETAREY